MEFLRPLRAVIVAYYTTHAQHPEPQRLPIQYGTSGFRSVGRFIPSIAARVAPVAILRSLHCGASVGIVVTASHNPAADNGMKLVDVDGGMLDSTWEPFCTELANTTCGESLYGVLEKWVKELGIMSASGVTCDALKGQTLYKDLLPNQTEPLEKQREWITEKLSSSAFPAIHIGRDTRASGEEVFNAITDVLQNVFHMRYVSHGIVSTPQLHTMVYLQNYASANRTSTPSEADYYTQILDALEKLLPQQQQMHGDAVKKQVLVVDAANGVGALKLKSLLAASHARGVQRDVIGRNFRVVVLNDNVEDAMALNKDCGADHCQRNKGPSEEMRNWSMAALHKAQGISIPVHDEVHYYSLDGDADRVVAFRHDCEQNTWSLLDGDRMAILFAMLLRHYMTKSALVTEPDVGIVQTAYANGASTEFVKNTLRLRTYCTPTGVKHLHPVAHARDCGVYFEANGHGTMLIKSSVAKLVPALGHLSQLLSQVCGDAIADLLACELALRVLTYGADDTPMTFKAWLGLYEDWPSFQVKIKVPDPRLMKTTQDEQTVLSPPGLQERISAAVQRAQQRMQEKRGELPATAAAAAPLARSFVRPSGTEPIVRLYAEAMDKDVADELAKEVEKAVIECMS